MSRFQVITGIVLLVLLGIVVVVKLQSQPTHSRRPAQSSPAANDPFRLR